MLIWIKFNEVQDMIMNNNIIIIIYFNWKLVFTRGSGPTIWQNTQ
jgi:hypothetical protein